MSEGYEVTSELSEKKLSLFMHFLEVLVQILLALVGYPEVSYVLTGTASVGGNCHRNRLQ